MTRDESNVLINHFPGPITAAVGLLWILTFAVLTALMAQIRVVLPFTPVPLTGQTFAVLLSGAVLGSRRGLLSQAVYLFAGAAGLPVFAGGVSSLASFFGPTGGYLLSFPLAAALIGWLVELGASRKLWRMAVALFLADALILGMGGLWLHFAFGYSASQSWLLGFYPFLIGDVLKIALVGLSLPKVIGWYDEPEVLPPNAD